MGQNVLTRIGLGAATGGLSEVAFGAKAGLDALSPKAPKPVQLRQESQQAERALQSAKGRAERLTAARGRKSFRIQLADADPRLTRSGISIG